MFRRLKWSFEWTQTGQASGSQTPFQTFICCRPLLPTCLLNEAEGLQPCAAWSRTSHDHSQQLMRWVLMPIWNHGHITTMLLLEWHLAAGDCWSTTFYNSPTNTSIKWSLNKYDVVPTQAATQTTVHVSWKESTAEEYSDESKPEQSKASTCSLTLYGLGKITHKSWRDVMFTNVR